MMYMSSTVVRLRPGAVSRESDQKNLEFIVIILAFSEQEMYNMNTSCIEEAMHYE